MFKILLMHHGDLHLSERFLINAVIGCGRSIRVIYVDCFGSILIFCRSATLLGRCSLGILLRVSLASRLGTPGSGLCLGLLGLKGFLFFKALLFLFLFDMCQVLQEKSSL